MSTAFDAASKAALTSGDFVGVFLSSPENRWESIRLPSRAALADWYSEWQGNPGMFTYLAIFDKTSSPWKASRAPVAEMTSGGIMQFWQFQPPSVSGADAGGSGGGAPVRRHTLTEIQNLVESIDGSLGDLVAELYRKMGADPSVLSEQAAAADPAGFAARSLAAQDAIARSSLYPLWQGAIAPVWNEWKRFYRGHRYGTWGEHTTPWEDFAAWGDRAGKLHAYVAAEIARRMPGEVLQTPPPFVGAEGIDMSRNRMGAVPHGGGGGFHGGFGGGFHGGGGGGARPRPPRWPGWGGGAWGAPWYGYGYPYYVYEVPEVIYETPVVYCEPGDPTCDPNAGSDPAFVVSGDLTITVSHAGERLAGLACGGLFDSIGDAIGGAVHGVTNVFGSAVGTVSHTLGQLKGPIGAAASMAAAAGAAGIPGVGPLVAPLAGSLAKNLVDAAAGGADVQAASQQVVRQAARQAQSNPQVAAALATAQRAVVQATAGYHAIQTAANASAGNRDAQAQIAELHGAAQAGDPGAQDMISLARSFGDALSRDDRASDFGTMRDPSYQIDPNAIEMDAPAKASGFVRLAGVREQAIAAAKEYPSRVIGIIQLADGTWKLEAFGDVNEADSWYDQWLALPHAFRYLAYYDRGSATFPGPENEAHGAPIGARVVASGVLLPVAAALGLGVAAGLYGPDAYHWAKGKLASHKAA